MKRSSQIALVLMGATAVGATSYAMTPPRRDCPPATVTQAAPGSPAAQDPCRQPRRWWSGYGFGPSWSSRSGWSSSSGSRSPTSTALRPSTSSTPSASRTSSSTSTSTTSRGGFGSTGHSVSSGS